MKTLNDSNNNFNSTKSHATQQSSFLSNGSLRTDSDIHVHPSLSTQNHFQRSKLSRTTNQNDQGSLNYTTQPITSTTKCTTQNNNNINCVQSGSNPFVSIVNADPNQLPAMLQNCLTKYNGNQMFQLDNINPIHYLQLINANAMLMQQWLMNQNNTSLPSSNPIKNNQSLSTPNVDLSKDTIHSGRSSQNLQPDSNIFVPKTRPMTQDEIAEHARLVYQRALQRNKIQQHTGFMKQFYETVNTKQNNSSMTTHTVKPIHIHQIPSVPNVATNGIFDAFDSVIVAPLSGFSNKEPSVINTALSSLSLSSSDDVKLTSNVNSTLDPSAPVFIPRRSRSKLHDDDDIETTSSSSDSDFNDFNYLDQFLEEFYDSNDHNDNHLIVRKLASSESKNIADESLNIHCGNNKQNINNTTLGQGDCIEHLTCETTNQTIQQSSPVNIDKSQRQYSIYDLLDRYRNPRSHLVLPEWSRLSIILPNVCSMRAHPYKIKRYFAYRRRLNEDQDFSIKTNISVQ